MTDRFTIPTEDEGSVLLTFSSENPVHEKTSHLMRAQKQFLTPEEILEYYKDSRS